MTIAEKLNTLPPRLRREAEDFIEFLAQKQFAPKRTHLRMKWAGALRDQQDQFTALELQKKSLDWWGD
ncbi:MAG: DUF2281 domain-containing protein [Verrucomicrobia bacterium]|nr:DUF2281 domain-containing protein [Verrucomicrobiota bacterium]